MIAVSSWAVDEWLLQQPAESRWSSFFDGLAERDIHRAEVCHFHLPEDTALFSEAAAKSGVTLQTLLIDDGDLTNEGATAEWEKWIAEKLRIAEALGFERARVIGGKTVAPNAVPMAAEALLRLAAGTKVRIITENWFGVLDTPEAVNEILDLTEGEIGLCADFGNWPASRKYEDLPKILARAETAHAKADFDGNGELEEESFRRLVGLAKDAGFEGPYVFVAGGWKGIEQSAAVIRELA
ncbi:sugar phosphate isomerase/epimerase [bacterium]|nr:MAG: sugar phosphate isomerase/epimerase [bacterium]